MAEAVTKEGRVSSKSVRELPLKPLTIPIRDEVRIIDSVATGFRQQMLDLRDEDGNGGSVASAAGLGSDFIHLEWNGRIALLSGAEILRAWVATFDPEAAARFPEIARTLEST